MFVPTEVLNIMHSLPLASKTSRRCRFAVSMLGSRLGIEAVSSNLASAVREFFERCSIACVTVQHWALLRTIGHDMHNQRGIYAPRLLTLPYL
jgi:hypothetical protein